MQVRIRETYPDRQLAGKLLLVVEEETETFAGWLRSTGAWTVVSKTEIEPSTMREIGNDDRKHA